MDGRTRQPSFAGDDVADPPSADPAPAAARLLAGGGLIVALLLLGIAARLGPVARLELRIDRHIAAHDRTAALTTLMKAVTIAGEPAIGIGVLIVLPAILVLLRRRHDALVAFCLVGGALALTEVVKQLINEHPPPLPPQAAGTDLGQSYPSGHTATAAVIAVTFIVIAATVAGRVAAIALGLPYALAVAASRVYLGYHYPLDVAGAFLCALAAALIVTGLAALPSVNVRLRRFLLLSGKASCCYLLDHPVPERGGNRLALAHIADRGEPGPAGQIRHLVRGKRREPWLAALRGQASDKLGVHVAVGVAQALRQHVVGDQLASRREPADGRQGLADRRTRQVKGGGSSTIRCAARAAAAVSAVMLGGPV